MSLVFALLAGILATIDPLLLRRLIDVELPKHALSSALLLVVIILVCLAGRSILGITSLYLNFTVQQDFAQSLRISMLDQLNRLSADFHEKTPVGDKLSRLENDVDQVSELGSTIVTALLQAIVLFAANVAVMLHLDVAMTLATTPALLVFLWARTRFGSSLKRCADTAQSEVGRASSTVTEYLAGILQVQLLGAEPVLLDKAASVWRQALLARRKQRALELRYAAIVNIAFVLSTVLVLGFGTIATLYARLTIGGLVAFYACAGRIFQPVSTAMEVYSSTQRIGASIRRIRAILESDAQLPDLGRILEPRASITRGISLQKISYGYLTGQHAIHELSLHLRPNSSVAIIGPSGSGKSTLARLLVRMADPEDGEILLDGYPFRDYSIAALRTTICYVPQQPLLFDGSIAENLRLGNPAATDADLEKVISITQLSSVVARLPNGVHTAIGPSGYSLSGGERQRVALARGLLRRAPILVMDESTSALDLPTEQRLLESVSGHRQHSLLIVISHRVSSIRWADQILVMNSGRIVATGDHDSLYRGCGLYKTLYESPSAAPVN